MSDATSLFNSIQLEILGRASGPAQAEVTRFTDEQRRMLMLAGLGHPQIDKLEPHLWLSQRLLADSSSLQDVRDEFESLSRAARTLQEALDRLTSAAGGATEEAFSRLTFASIGGPDVFDALQAGLIDLQQRIAGAAHSLGGNQRRPREMAWLVVGVIDKVLQEAGADAVRFKPSYAMSSCFRQVASVVFDAATGTEGNDPERAIKAYVRWRRKGLLDVLPNGRQVT